MVGGAFMIFAYAHYTQFLAHMKTIAPIRTLDEWRGEPAILLRHDVDLTIDAAHRLAMIEADAGVRSSYFILTTCHTYNTLSADNRERLREMVELGFEVGLHFDPTIYGEIADDALAPKVDQEAGILASVIGREVHSVSLHNPSIHGQYPLFAGYINAHDPALFSEDAYFSDSRMDFRGKDPYEFVEQARRRTVQILLHPLHYTPDGDGYRQIMSQFVRDFADRLDASFRVNSTYVEQLPEHLLHYVLEDA